MFISQTDDGSKLLFSFISGELEKHLLQNAYFLHIFESCRLQLNECRPTHPNPYFYELVIRIEFESCVKPSAFFSPVYFDVSFLGLAFRFFFVFVFSNRLVRFKH